jgi:glycosyltransferase involved in cell wall biosynthesis
MATGEKSKIMQTLSVVIITLNEADNLERCLNSVGFADEIIVVDSGSDDATCEVAKRYTDKVVYRKFDGFGKQKQFALDMATSDWVLSLDADEWCAEDLQLSIQRVLEQAEHTVDGYHIFRLNYYLGRAMYQCGWYTPILRLFKRKYAKFNDKLVHEEVILDGVAGSLDGDILHVPYRDVLHHIEKMQRYVRLDAQEVLQKGRRFDGLHAPVHILLRPGWKFIEKYIVQRGFLEGLHGLILSILAAFGVFLIHVHAWHQYHQKQDS